MRELAISTTVLWHLTYRTHCTAPEGISDNLPVKVMIAGLMYCASSVAPRQRMGRRDTEVDPHS